MHALAAKLGLARLVLLAERAWMLTWPASGFLLLYLAVSLFDAWSFVSPALHKLALAALAAASVYSIARNLERFAFPRAATAMRRLEGESGLTHRPLDSLGEKLAAGRGDPVAEALWRAHEARDRSRIDKIGLLWPRLSLAARDPRALRFLALLLFAAGIAAAGADALPRLDKAFALMSTGNAAPAVRIDAWINPPAYTKLPPVFLSQGPQRAGTDITAGPVPAGSTLTIRIQGQKVQPRLRHAEHEPDHTARMRLASTGPDAFSGTILLGRAATVELKSALSTLARFEIAVSADIPPVISFSGPPQVTAQKALRIAYRTQDDYGIVSVQLRMSRTSGEGGAAETFDLPAPGAAGQTVLHANEDLTAHPWAGLPVRLSLLARDGAGQDGTSESVTITLPERLFTNPLARALAAARRDMMRDPRQSTGAAHVIDQVSEALADPEADPDNNREGSKAMVLALRSAYWALADAAERSEDGRLHAAALMWQVAVALEDGAAGEAKNALDRARQALADALKHGAPETEIAQRMAALRQALARYLTAMQAKMTEPMQGPINPQIQAITPQDLARLLDTLENLARTGAKGEAEKLLSALDDILQNLATNNGAGSEGESAGEEAMKALGDLIGEERALMDETFRATQADGDEKPAQGSRGQSLQGQSSQGQSLRALAERQEKLRRALGQAMTQLGERAGAIPRSLGRSERAMSAAREALGNGQGRNALAKQQDALDALREGARDIAEAMARAGQGRPGRAPGFGGMPSSDPFGRPNAGAPDQGDSVKVPSASEAQRARGILEEIRRRAAERGRPPEELDYLDRLLQRF